VWVAAAVEGGPAGTAGVAGVAGVSWDICGAPVGVAAAAMAASTSGRHRTRLREPGGRPLGLVWLMSKVGGGEPGALGGVGFQRTYGGRDKIVECVGEEVLKSTSSIEAGVQGAGVDGFLDASGQVVVILGEVGDVFGTEVVVCGAGMVAYGGYIGVGEGLGDFVVMFLQTDVHGSFGLADVCGCAWVVGGAGAWSVIHN
jgi:hypothetical protein